MPVLGLGRSSDFLDLSLNTLRASALAVTLLEAESVQDAENAGDEAHAQRLGGGRVVDQLSLDEVREILQRLGLCGQLLLFV